MFKRVRIEHLTWRKNQGFDVWFLFLRSERGFFAVVKQQVLADSGEHLWRDRILRILAVSFWYGFCLYCFRT